jgi:hypothetical protein
LNGTPESLSAADHRDDVGRDVRVHRHDGDDDLDFIGETFGEQRADGTVDQARGENFIFRGAAFAAEEAARDLPGGVGAFLIVDGEREEVLTGLRFLHGDHSGEHHGVAHRGHDRAARLPRDLTRFECDAMLSVLNRLYDFCQCPTLSSSLGIYLRRPRRSISAR